MTVIEEKTQELLTRVPDLQVCRQEIVKAGGLLADTVKAGGKILLCGNGGSSADCDHISGELLKGFLLKRRLGEIDRRKFSRLEGGPALADKLQYGICAVPLNAMTAAYTAYLNDEDPCSVLAQLTFALGRPGDAIVCISTSGNAENVCRAAICAAAIGLRVIGLTGQSGGRLRSLADCCIRVPRTETMLVQELHLPVYHCICAALEQEIFGA